MGSAPTLTIGVPVFNGAAYLEAAVESVLEQSFGDFEMIISDNASTDDTGAICRALVARDTRVTYRRNAENVGSRRTSTCSFRSLAGACSSGRPPTTSCGPATWSDA